MNIKEKTEAFNINKCVSSVPATDKCEQLPYLHNWFEGNLCAIDKILVINAGLRIRMKKLGHICDKCRTPADKPTIKSYVWDSAANEYREINVDK